MIAVRPQPLFNEAQVGDRLPDREYGPLRIEDTVRWAGLQENWARGHYDRDHVRERTGLPSFYASGAYREALLVRLLTDWIGPRGWLRKLSVRQAAPTFEGDLLRYTGVVVERSSSPTDPWLVCDLEGKNQEDRQVVSGRCTVVLPTQQVDELRVKSEK